MYQKVEQYLSDKRPYLDSQLTLQALADHLNLTIHVLSQVINEHTGKNFSELMNNKRIAHAMELMQRAEYMDEKIIVIAYDSGFNNKASFINAFKKANSCTPSEYRKQLPPLGKMSLAS